MPEIHAARRDRAFVIHDAGLRRQVRPDLRIHETFDLDELSGRQRLEVREIEA